MKALRKALRRPWVACLLINVLVLGAVLGMRAKGWLQRAELIVYDQFIRWRSDPNSRDDRIAIVGMTEDDLVKYGFPLGDAMLARVLEGVDAQQPVVIGLDLYRNLPEPRTREQYPQLEAALRKLDRVIAIKRIGFVDAPPALAEMPERISANNLPSDEGIDGVCRRGPLFCEADVPEPMPSFSLALTLAYLDAHGIDYGVVDSSDGNAKLLRLGKSVIQRFTQDAGGYVGRKPRHYEYLIDFRAPRAFRVQDPLDQSGTDTPYDYSFGDVIEGRLPAGALSGKIVFLATVMQSIKDSIPTPIDGNLRGVQMHVMMVNQLLAAALEGRAPLSWWPEWAEVAWIAFWALLGGVLGVTLRSPWKLAPALLLFLGALGFAAWWMFENGTWILAPVAAAAAFVSATFVTSFIAYLERSERGHMQTLFSKHVSSDVVEALWAERDQFLDGGRMKPQRVTATVLFTDLKGFSTTSEKMDPATLMDWMNEYFGRIARHVESHGGVINKFIGDAIMGIFGVPLARTSEEGFDADAVHAVECGLAMRRELALLNAEWRAAGKPTTAMRVGIFTGPLVSGSLGTSDRLEFTVLGDTVNTAARLEAAGKEASDDPRTAECTILIGDSTFQRLRGKFETQPIGAMSLKGKADKIIVHSVISAT